MIEFSLLFLGIAFVAGLITFFAPCTLPLVPAFLGVIAGVKQDELQDEERLKEVRGRIFINALFYVLGFSTIFILFGIAFSLVGQIAGVQDWINRIGGVLIILFGLFILELFKIGFLNVRRQIHYAKLYKNASKVNSFGIGALFALGWSPCVGPILGGILLLASTSGQVIQGTILLVAFAAGLGLPFLITSLLVGRALAAFQNWGRILNIINKVAGVFLVVLGVLLLTGYFDDVFRWLQSVLGGLNFLQEFLIKFDGGLSGK